MNEQPGGLGRKVPTDWTHVEAYPLRVALPEAVASVERTLVAPSRLAVYMDQQREGACVGASLTWLMEILNGPDPGPAKYRFFALYARARQVDEWPGENYDGTSVRAGCDVLRKEGHTPFAKKHDEPWAWAPDPALGISENRWASSIDELRASISMGLPFVLGINWHSAFDTPETVKGESWIGRQAEWGTVRGGHAICAYAASDKRQAFKLVNTWGLRYPRVWIPYTAVERLLAEEGEAVVVTDR